MNIPLAHQILDKMAESPLSFFINNWGHKTTVDEDHPCGMKGCFSGTAIWLTNRNKFNRLVFQRQDYTHQAQERTLEWNSAQENSPWLIEGAKALQLRRSQAIRLFLPHYWPEEWEARLDQIRTDWLADESDNTTKADMDRKQTELCAEYLCWFIHHEETIPI